MTGLKLYLYVSGSSCSRSLVTLMEHSSFKFQTVFALKSCSNIFISFFTSIRLNTAALEAKRSRDIK